MDFLLLLKRNYRLHKGECLCVLIGFVVIIIAFLIFIWLPLTPVTLGSLCLRDVVCLLLGFSIVLLASAVFFYLVRHNMLPVLMLLLVLNGLVIVMVFFSHTKEVLLKQNLDPLNYAGLILDWTAMGVTIVTIGTGLVWLFIGTKVNEVKTTQDKIQRNLVATAEIALRGLPPFDESQQIPIRCLAPLKEISDIVFDDMDPSIVDFLDRTGNGVRLRLAKACYLYGRGALYYDKARSFLKEALEKTKLTNYSDRKLAQYRYGILERQLRDYKSSMATFLSLGNEALLHHDKAFFQHACVGIAVSLLALFNDTNALAGLDQKDFAERIVGPILTQNQITVGLNNPLLEHAYSLLSFVYKENFHHVMASMYLTKVCNKFDPSGAQLITPEPDIGRISAEQTRLYLDRLPIHEDLNIEANYEWCRALCNEYLGEYARAINHLDVAIKLTKSLSNTYPNIEMYSETVERQVPPEDCIKHMEQIKNRITIKQQTP